MRGERRSLPVVSTERLVALWDRITAMPDPIVLADHPWDACQTPGCCDDGDPDAVCVRCDLPRDQHPVQEDG